MEPRHSLSSTDTTNFTPEAEKFLATQDYAAGYVHFSCLIPKTFEEFASRPIFMISGYERAKTRKALENYLANLPYSYESLKILINLSRQYEELKQFDLALSVYGIALPIALAIENSFTTSSQNSFIYGQEQNPLFATLAMSIMTIKQLKLSLLSLASYSAIQTGQPNLIQLFRRNFLSENTLLTKKEFSSRLELENLSTIAEYHQSHTPFTTHDQDRYVRAVNHIETNGDHSIFYYFTALNTQEIKTRNNLLKDCFNGTTNIKFKMLASIALYQIGELKFASFFNRYSEHYSAFKPAVNAIDNICVYLIATRLIHKQTKDKVYADTIRQILASGSPLAQFRLLPFAIPLYLRQAFMEVLLDQDYWPVDVLSASEFDNLELAKQQYISLIESGDASGLDKEMRVNLAAQALCPQTYIGNIINVEVSDNPVLKNNIITTPSKLCFIKYLNIHFHKKQIEKQWLTPSTKTAFLFFVNDKNYFNPLLTAYPDLAKNILETFDDSPPLLDSQLRILEQECKSVIQAEREGNHAEADKQHDIVFQSIHLSGKKLASHHVTINDLVSYYFKNQCYRLVKNIHISAGKAFRTYQFYDQLSIEQRLQVALSFIYQNDNDTYMLVPLFEKLNISTQKHYWTAAKKEYQDKKQIAYSREPQGLHRLTQQPELDLTTYYKLKEKALASSPICIERVLARSLYLIAFHNKNLALKNLLVLQRKCALLRESNAGNPHILEYEQTANYFLGRIALSERDYAKAFALFCKSEEAGNVSAQIIEGKIKALTSADEIEKAKALLEKIAINSENQITIILAHAHIANVDEKHKEVVLQLLSQLDTFAYRSPRDNCMLALIYHQIGDKLRVRDLLTHSNLSPTRAACGEFLDYREDYLALLQNSDYWPDKYPPLPTGTNPDHLRLLKIQYVEWVSGTKDLNTAFQALCPTTPIGHLLHLARDTTFTSFSKGTLYEMLMVINDILKDTEKNIQQEIKLNTEHLNAALDKSVIKDISASITNRRLPKLSATTKQVIIHLFKNNADFNSVLEKFPETKQFCKYLRNKEIDCGFFVTPKSTPRELTAAEKDNLTKSVERHFEL